MSCRTTMSQTLAVLVILVAVALASAASAQDVSSAPSTAAASDRGLRFGVKGGLNVASLRNEEAGTTRRLGPVAGAFVEWQSGGVLGIELEGLYSSKGTSTGLFTVKIDYIEIPALVKLGVGAGSTRVFFVTGPAVAFKVRATNGSSLESVRNDFDTFVRGWDIGWLFGGGIDVPLPHGSLSLEARYTLGLRPIFNADATDSDRDDKNQALAFIAGYRF